MVSDLAAFFIDGGGAGRSGKQTKALSYCFDFFLRRPSWLVLCFACCVTKHDKKKKGGAALPLRFVFLHVLCVSCFAGCGPGPIREQRDVGFLCQDSALFYLVAVWSFWCICSGFGSRCWPGSLSVVFFFFFFRVLCFVCVCFFFGRVSGNPLGEWCPREAGRRRCCCCPPHVRSRLFLLSSDAAKLLWAVALQNGATRLNFVLAQG